MVRELLDRAAIEELISRYAIAVDERRTRELTDLYVDGFLLELHDGIRFRLVRPGPGPAVRYHAERDEPLPDLGSPNDGLRTQHLTSNVVITLDGDRATARASLIGVHAGAGGRGFGGGWYAFEVLRTHDGWRLSRVTLNEVVQSHDS